MIRMTNLMIDLVEQTIKKNEGNRLKNEDAYSKVEGKTYLRWFDRD